MLKKLFKYDWKSFWKVPAAINLFLIIITIVGVISLISPFWALNYEIMDILMVTAVMFYYIAIFAGSMTISVYIAMRYYKNVYTDEGYLTHTLPVTPRQIILSKMFVSIIWTVITGIVVFTSVILIVLAAFGLFGGNASWQTLDLIQEFQRVWPEFVSLFERELGISVFGLGLFLVIYSIVSTVFSILMIYSAIALGQLFTTHKVMGAVIWYIGEYAIIQIASSLLFNVPILFNITRDGFMGTSGGDLLRPTMVGSILLTLILSFVSYFIAEYMMKKKLNLD